MDLRAKLKKLNLCTIFGICTMLIGCWWLFLTAQQMLEFLTNGKEWDDYLFFSIFLSILAPPCGFAAYFGFHLIKEKNKRNIKGSVGSLAVFAVFFLYVLVEWWVLPNHIGTPLSFLIMTIAAVLIYIPVSRFLMIREGLTPKPKGEFVGKGIILIIALQIWLVGIQTARVYEPKEIEIDQWSISDRIALLLIFFAPIVVAWIFYKVSMKFIEDKASGKSS